MDTPWKAQFESNEEFSNWQLSSTITVVYLHHSSLFIIRPSWTIVNLTTSGLRPVDMTTNEVLDEQKQWWNGIIVVLGLQGKIAAKGGTFCWCARPWSRMTLASTSPTQTIGSKSAQINYTQLHQILIFSRVAKWMISRLVDLAPHIFTPLDDDQGQGGARNRTSGTFWGSPAPDHLRASFKDPSTISCWL